MKFELYYRDAAPSIVGVHRIATPCAHQKLLAAGYRSTGFMCDDPPIRLYEDGTHCWRDLEHGSEFVDLDTVISADVDMNDDDGEDDDEDYDEDDADGIPARDVAWEGLGRVLSAAGELATHHEPYYHDSLLTMVGTLLDEANGLFRDLQELE